MLQPVHIMINLKPIVCREFLCDKELHQNFLLYFLLYKNGVPTLLISKDRDTACMILFKYSTYPARCSDAADNLPSALPA